MTGFLNEQNQGQQKNMFLFVLAALAVTMVYTAFVTPPPPPGGDPAAEVDGSADTPAVAEVLEPAPDGSGDAAPDVIAEAEPVPAFTLAGTNHEVSISNVGGRLTGVTIREPEQYVPRESIIGVFPAASEFHFPLALEIGGLPDLREDSVYEVISAEGPDGANTAVEMRWTSPDGSIQVTRSYTSSELAFGIDAAVEVENLSTATRRFESVATLMYGEFSPESGGLFNRSASILEGICAGDFGVKRRPARKIEELRSYGVGQETVAFGGIDEQYFMTALVPLEGTVIGRCGYEPVDGNHVVTRMESPPFELAAGATQRFEFSVYTGPKHVDYLTPFPGELKRSVDLGFFSFLALPIRWALLLFQGWVINWGLAIIVLTISIKIVLFPITQKGYTSMEKMKRVQPQLKKIQEKYASDRMKLAEEQMKLFKDEGVSPMSGCLPMLMQMPIYFALYRTIWGSAELYNAPFVLWVQDLSQPDPLFILPLLMGVVMFFQQQLMPQAVDNPQMKMVNRIMPIMFTAMMLFLPSGLVLYIFVNMLLSIAQMLYIKKKHSKGDEGAAKA